MSEALPEAVPPRRRRDLLSLPAIPLAMLAREVAVQVRRLGPERVHLETLGIDLAALPAALVQASDDLRAAATASKQGGAALRYAQFRQRQAVAAALLGFRQALALVRYQSKDHPELARGGKVVDAARLRSGSVAATRALLVDLSRTLHTLDLCALPDVRRERDALDARLAALDAASEAVHRATCERAVAASRAQAAREALAREIRTLGVAWRIAVTASGGTLLPMSMNDTKSA